MSILPTWPIAAGALVIGLAGGAWIDHRVMQGRIDKITIAHAKQEEQRLLQRTRDEVAARENERILVERANQIEQERLNEVANIRSQSDALIARLRQQAASKPANPSGVPTPATTCQSPAGGELPSGSREAVVWLAERAEAQRAALSACYNAYDSIGP